jgi:hypothetical protein
MVDNILAQAHAANSVITGKPIQRIYSDCKNGFRQSIGGFPAIYALQGTARLPLQKWPKSVF